jgi:hypothetical protein
MFYVTIYQLSSSLYSNKTACLIRLLQALWIQVGYTYFDKREHFTFRYLLITPFLSGERKHKFNLSKSQNLERVRVNIFMARQPRVDLGLFTSWSHSDTSHAVALHKSLSDNTQNSQVTSMPPAGLKPAMPRSQQPQTQALDGTATCK